MKTFKDLKLGDNIFTVLSQGNVVRKISEDGYEIHSGNITHKKEVQSMEVEEGYLGINARRDYRGVSYDFKIPASELDSYSFTEKGNIIFVDYQLACQFVRQKVMEAIKVEEMRIPDTIKSVEENIKSIRHRYYHVLNNIDHDVLCSKEGQS